MPRAEWSFIGGMRVVRPPLPEQTAIARFLAHATGRIERYIRTKEKLIALLEEQKQVEKFANAATSRLSALSLIHISEPTRPY